MWIIADILMVVGIVLIFGGNAIPGIVMLVIGGILFWRNSATRKYLNNNKR